MIDRYSRSVMKNIWTDESKFQAFLDVEIACTHAFSKLNIVPIEDYLKIKNNAKFNVNRIREIENETKHDVIAFTRNVSESLGDEKKWVHYGLTSTDIKLVGTAYSGSGDPTSANCSSIRLNSAGHAEVLLVGATGGKFGSKYSFSTDANGKKLAS